MEGKKSLDEILAEGKRGKRWVWGIAIFCALLALSLSFFFIRKNPSAKVQYLTERVIRGNLTVTVSATGTLEPLNQVEVGTEISGIIRSIEVDYNQKVRKGQVLARLDTEEMEAELLQAKASLKDREATLKKAEANLKLAREKLKQMLKAWELSGGKTPSLSEIEAQRAQVSLCEAELLSAQAKLEEAQALVKLKESQLSKAIIRSPIDGIVLGRHVEEGQTVVASLESPTLFTLAEDLSKMQLTLAVDEADIAQVKEGQRAIFTVDAYPDREFEGTVKEVRFYPEASEGVVTYEVVLEVENPKLLLRPGMTATAEIIVKELKDVLLVPNSALRFNPPGAARERQVGGFTSLFLPRFPRRQPQAPSRPTNGEGRVWVLDEGVPKPITVKVGPTNDHYTQVISPKLKPGMEVITGMLVRK